MAYKSELDDSPEGAGGGAAGFESFVSEAGEVRRMLGRLGAEDAAEADAAAEAVCRTLEKYQEQPELLDAHLEEMVVPVMDLVRSDMRSTPRTHRCFRVVYALCKVRGYKTVVKFMPHQVGDLEPTLRLLLEQDGGEHATWETRYGLLMWLSIIVRIPFDLSTVDSDLGRGREGGIVGRIIDVAKGYLGASGAAREAAGVLLSRFFSRNDMHSSHLASFLRWARDRLAAERPPIHQLTGVFWTLAQVFKHAPRAALQEHVGIVYDVALDHARWSPDRCHSGLVRKLSVKLAQRVGLVYLRPAVAAWRYQRGHRSLMQSLEAPAAAEKQSEGEATPAAAQEKADADASADADADPDVPEQVDDVVERLLNGLREPDTVVRWSAAKGVGRLTMRLPVDFADDVVGAVLDLFSAAEGDGAWHGGCLALAELARRGLLLPGRLPAVVPLVTRALVYDVRKGAHSVGAHVRDAACYVCWAFARAYDPAVMEPYVLALAPQLLAVAVFDREINCRRAAAAAFQENVGRQGNFPNGIDINTAADYFTLGNRVNAYLGVSVYIAGFPTYTRHLIRHLVEHKLRHWDQAVRELAARALHRLCACDGAYLHDSVLPLLVPACLSRDLCERHGSVVAIGEVLTGLRKVGHTVRASLAREVCGVFSQLEERRLLQGRGGHLMRAAAMHLAQSVARAGVTLASDDEAAALLAHVSQNLEHNDEEIQARAAAAGAAFCRQYFPESAGEARAAVFSRAMRKWVVAARRPGQTAYPRRGACMMIGLLPRWLLLPHLSPAVDALAAASRVDPENAHTNDVETRRNAVAALGEVCVVVGGHARAREGQPQLLHRVFPVLLEALQDYSTDNRGDIGSWVREAAMVAAARCMRAACGLAPGPRPRVYSEPVVPELGAGAASSVVKATTAAAGGGEDQREAKVGAAADRFRDVSEVEQELLAAPAEAHPEILDEDTVRAALSGLVKQMGEKINRMRRRAGRLLHSLLHETAGGGLPRVPHREELERVFPADDAGFDWSSPAALFPRLMRLLDLDAYARPTVEGVLISVGGLTESLVRAAGDALVAHVSPLPVWGEASPRERERVPPAGTVDRVAFDLVAVLWMNRGRARVVTPGFKTACLLLEQGCFEPLGPEHCSFTLDLHRQLRGEIFKSKDIVKIMAATSVFLGLLAFENPTRNMALRSALLLLCHRYPKVRRLAGEELYTCMLTLDFGLEEEQVDEIMAILSETTWDGPCKDNRPVRDRLFPMFGLELPTKSIAASEARQAEMSKGEGGEAEGNGEHTYAEFLRSLA